MTEESEQGCDIPKIIEQIGGLASGLPPQAQRSFWKAAGRVLIGLAEWPAAYFEGRAALTRGRIEAEANEIRAKQRAREVVLIQSAEAAGQQFDDPRLALRALEYHAADLVREQAGREAVLQIAAEELNALPPTEDVKEEIDDDWLTLLLKESSSKSSEDLRLLFGKILAGEIRTAGTFSMRTLQSLGMLTQQVAQSFQQFCNCSTKISKSKVISNPL